MQFKIEPCDNQRLAMLCGQYDENLRQIERYLGVEIVNRGNDFQIIGSSNSIKQANDVIVQLYQETEHAKNLSADKVHLVLQGSNHQPKKSPIRNYDDLVLKTKKQHIKARTPNQYDYLKNISENTINFGIGPAGTGKTYLAVAHAVVALTNETVERLILVRPAVEAGEKLGFLPGDMTQKVDPYLRPIYDALYDMLGAEDTARLIEKGIIEIAPLAFMRGRTLNNAFVILDESQNTTREQMLMFLTRIGFGSTAVITGDITQIDLPRQQESGLRHAIEVLKNVKDVSFTFFQADDVMRHPLVQRVIEAYDKSKR